MKGSVEETKRMNIAQFDRFRSLRSMHIAERSILCHSRSLSDESTRLCESLNRPFSYTEREGVRARERNLPKRIDR